ncbi:small conductance mechanosensitive channel [Anoxybacillus vitaminiphilus]|uniref:Small conductance mechanosensitive channel n=1 Tax=Paranoxybacillus vitaminiphilus TaxID=581036 RepID=A0A327YHZ1_9BACL|nr:mechanosensitive ion channel family protein [Anoxybacillus vitaminiphilus]RAK20563.1 small conductance mechanosensitive channel [Anoxybacillus vitaminiphilus]
MSSVEKLYNKMLRILTNEDLWMNIGLGLVKIIAIIVLSTVFLKIVKLALHNVFKVRQKTSLRISERREATLLRLLDNVLTYVVYFVVIMMILDTVGIPVTTILAGAGIVGLAVGFGAQSLVKDIITGFFIIFEDQFSVGDYVRIGNFEGYVEEIGLRTTKIKSWTGEVHILPNGSINQVTNFSLNNSIAVVDVSIAYEGDIERTENIIRELLAELPAKYEDMVKAPELLGIQNFGQSEIVLRVTCETKPMRHWFIARALRKEIKLRLDEHGIEIPFPRLVLYNRQEEAEPVQKTMKSDA